MIWAAVAGTAVVVLIAAGLVLAVVLHARGEAGDRHRDLIAEWRDRYGRRR